MSPAVDKVYAVEIAAAPERVWHEITRRDRRCRPMFGTVLVSDLVPGAALRYRSTKGKHTFVAGEVLEVEAPRRLVHTFTFPNLPDAPTRVTWTLEPSAKGTRLTVTHERLEPGSRTLKAVDGSWPGILELYRQEVETGTVGLGTRMKLALMGAMSFMLPRSLRTDVVEAHLERHPPRLA
jgi:uncharacterized protein YndB with AHSA1/START domain